MTEEAFPMFFSNKHVVITGGTGALGTAVVGALLEDGAQCTIPYVHEREAQAFPHREQEHVKLIAVRDLADEADVARVYAAARAPLWASIHIAGGFAMGNIAETDKGGLMTQLEANFL